MGKYMKNVIGIACLSLSFQTAVIVVNAKDLPQDQPEKAPTSSSPVLPDLSNQLAMLANSIADSAESKVRTEVKSEANAEANAVSRTENVIASPKVALKNPALNLKVTAREAKLDTRPFAVPDLSVLGEAFSFRATAYALRGQTSSGGYVRRGIVAADPRVLPLGSVVEIKAGKYSGVYGVYDTGKKIKGKIIDLWVPSTYEARQFGRRDIKLHILRYGAPKQRTRR